MRISIKLKNIQLL